MTRKRRSQTTCTCTAYHFPHRDCSGRCAFGDIPATLRKHDRGRGFVGDDAKRPECVKRAARKAHKTAGKHGAARAQAAARRRGRAMVG